MTRSHVDYIFVSVLIIVFQPFLGIAYTNNEYTQTKIAEEGAIPVLVQLLNNLPLPEMQVEVVTTLACIVLHNHDNQSLLSQEDNFRWDRLLDLLQSSDQNVRLRVGMALTVFSFNNISYQLAIRQTGGIRYDIFEGFLESTDPYFKCYAAFQIVILARVIIGRSAVFLTASGISLLVQTLQAKDDDVVVLAASLLSSLAHTRAGITDAMITVGALDLLVDKLTASPSSQVRKSVAVTLGYLTFNPTAARILFATCRNIPGLYDSLIKNIGENPKISTKFTDDFKRARLVGLPSQWSV